MCSLPQVRWLAACGGMLRCGGRLGLVLTRELHSAAAMQA